MQRSSQKASLLRDIGRSAILEILNKSSFTRHNFEVAFDVPKDRAALVQITYAHNKTFLFKISKHAGYPREPRYTTFECPGDELTEPKRYDRPQLEDCLAALASWIQRIVDDARHASPLFDDFQAFKDALRQELAQPSPVTAPNPSWAQEIQARFEALTLEMETLKAQHTFQTKQVEELTAKFNALPAEPGSAPREPWYKPTGTKIVE